MESLWTVYNPSENQTQNEPYIHEKSKQTKTKIDMCYNQYIS
jgi:hypothetical protein